jgi:alkanesulfonate monooxygenase SsuD/methylene tetrahydromethanopterin reductase-like flavin-dependent oxidoreductase (luciferase family)
MFGAAMKDHHDRYAQAAEWIEILRALWSRDDAFDYEGEYYTVKKGISMPKPIQRPFPPIMNAGGSDRGRAFAAKYSDMAFVIVRSDDVDEIRRETDAYRKLAREEYGRDLQVWTLSYVVQGDTEQDARDRLNYYVVEHGDDRALDGFMNMHNMHSQLMPKDVMEAMKFRLKAGHGGYELVGTADKITAQLDKLSKGGIDGVLLSWFSYEDGVKNWIKDVKPRLVQAGLRSA